MNLVEKKFEEYLVSLEDQDTAKILREAVWTLPGTERREFIIKHLPSAREIAVHEAHCTTDSCKYGDADCPVMQEMHEWNVPVTRVSYGYNLIAVSARTEEEAVKLALEQAGDELFNERNSEYVAPDGAQKISNENK
jgi:hypothetical protein